MPRRSAPLVALGVALAPVAIFACRASPGAAGAPATNVGAPPIASTPAVDASTPAVLVETSPGRSVNTFRPDRALGTSIDRIWSGSTDELYSPAVLQQIMTAGWGAVTYRINTELHVEAW